MTWEALGNKSRVDFYHYQVFNNLIKVNASVILESNTANTTVIIDADGIRMLFVVPACNCKGSSDPVALVISNGEEKKSYHGCH